MFYQASTLKTVFCHFIAIVTCFFDSGTFALATLYKLYFVDISSLNILEEIVINSESVYGKQECMIDLHTKYQDGRLI